VGKIVLGDGEHINYVFNVGSMDDTGTRLKFLMELYELWVTGIDILDRYTRNAPNYHEKRLELEHAVQLLYWHMTKDYGRQEELDRRLIDTLPKHGDEIPKP
jgi:hypothetical protein